MNAKQSETQGIGFHGQLPDRYHPIAADLSSCGMGNYEDMQRNLILPLQSHFQKEMRGDDGGRNLPGKACQRTLCDVVLDQLLFLGLFLAIPFRFAADKWDLLSDTMRSIYR